MDRGTVERIEAWDAHSLTGGYDGLHNLADADFSGAITNGAGWLLMLNGRIIGEFRGSLADFESSDLTAYEAPHPALVLLFAVKGSDGETQAQYYTDDTPIAEVNDTLTDGNFTGYIELSENVLSGDYYVVYYGGRSMSVAFIGNSNRVITGNEAFDRANDEVGIYEVISVDLDVKEIPAPETPSETAAATAEQDVVDPEPDPPAEATDTQPPSETASTTETTAPVEADEPQEAPAEAITEAEPDSGHQEEPTTEPPAETDTTAQVESGSDAADASQDPFSEEEEWRQARTVPALDPDETSVEDTSGQPQPQANESAQQSTTQQEPSTTPNQGVEDRVAELEAALESRTEELTELREQVETLDSQRDRLKEERDKLKQQVNRLQSSPNSSGEIPGQQLDRTEALSQTDVFIRYGSKGQATLEKAHNGGASAEDVNSNLQLETHTRFDADTVAVEGAPFIEFLPRSIEYRFIEWVIRNLLYEIQGTNSQRALRDLYDVLPRIDRAEFKGSVSFEREDGGEDQRTFDVVLRDRMGQLLIVADINDARDPASGDMMAELVEAATSVGESHDSLGAAFFVTSSFFEPAALETANDASGGGFLKRDSRKSFVKLSRKNGFHLCLIEARGDAFHVAVPEL